MISLLNEREATGSDKLDGEAGGRDEGGAHSAELQTLVPGHDGFTVDGKGLERVHCEHDGSCTASMF